MSTSSSYPSGEPRGGARGREDFAGNEPMLSPESAESVDRLLGGGLDATGAGDAGTGRVRRVLELLNLPDAEVARNKELLIDLTIARVSRAAHRRKADLTGGSFMDGDLSPDDDDALEALVEAGMDPARVPGSLRARAARQMALLSTLDGIGGAEADRERLVTRTLAMVQDHIERDESRLELVGSGAGLVESAGQSGFRPRFRLSDLVTVAALILIGFGVLAPITSAVQGYSRRMECASNMQAAGLGFGLYAGSNKEALPMASASPAGRMWWLVGRDPAQSNAANLFTLVRTGNTTLGSLACPGNLHAVSQDPRKDAQDWGRVEEVSYSFQNLFASERPKWSQTSRTIVLVDRSPVILKAIMGRPIDPVENSPNHEGRGQSALFNDGSVVWLRSPTLENGDNIWLPRRIEYMIRQLTSPRNAAPLQGTESPDSADDVFVGP